MSIKGKYNKEDIEKIVSLIIPKLKNYQVEQVYDCDTPKNVFLISTDTDKYVLKVAGQYEIEVYEKYLKRNAFEVPFLLGQYKYDDETDFIMISFVEGNELSDFCEVYAIEAAKSIAKIHNSYFTEQRNDTRYLNYLKRIAKRAESLKNEPVLKKAYRLFLERQQTIPLTVCHGDYLPCNAIFSGEKVYIIDWGNSGYMPYALDVARMIAHGVLIPTEETFPFSMTEWDKKVFLKTYLGLINLSISEDEFYQDILLAKLNEYIEFIEEELIDNPDEVKNDLYYKLALETAEKIMEL